MVDDASAVYIGLISGTSADSIDSVLVSFPRGTPQLLASHSHPWPSDLRERMLALAQGDAAITLDAFGHLDAEIGHGFADELFRVFARSHPRLALEPVNMATGVRALIDSVRAEAT